MNQEEKAFITSVFLNLQVLIFNLKKYGKNSFLFGGKA